MRDRSSGSIKPQADIGADGVVGRHQHIPAGLQLGEHFFVGAEHAHGDPRAGGLGERVEVFLAVVVRPGGQRQAIAEFALLGGLGVEVSSPGMWVATTAAAIPRPVRPRNSRRLIEPFCQLRRVLRKVFWSIARSPSG
jgi:hypothetical protein